MMGRLIEGGRNQRSRQLSLVVRLLLSDPISKNTSRYKRLSRMIAAYLTHATLASSVEISSHPLVVSTPTARIHVLFPKTASQLKSQILVDEYKETGERVEDGDPASDGGLAAEDAERRIMMLATG